MMHPQFVLTVKPLIAAGQEIIGEGSFYINGRFDCAVLGEEIGEVLPDFRLLFTPTRRIRLELSGEPISALANGIGAEVGSILLPKKEQSKIFDKIDDLRYDIRGTRDVIGAGLFALAGAGAILAFGKIYKAARG